MHEETPQGRLDPQGVYVLQYAQVLPQGDQVPIGGEGNEVPVVPPHMTKGEIRENILTLTRALKTRVTTYIGQRMNALENTMTSWLRDFVKTNNPIFLVSKVREDPQEFSNSVYKALGSMGVSFRKNPE